MTEANNTLNEQQIKKRKRKTSDEQYELYLTEMESDYVFRSGTINPTLGENYMENKWTSLAEKLNATGNGPQLPVEEWKRRFKDWKNSTRSKYRKIHISRNATGGGPPSNLKLTPLEDRGLSVWGRVTVTGFEGVEEGGLPISSGEIPVLVQEVESTDLEAIDLEANIVGSENDRPPEQNDETDDFINNNENVKTKVHKNKNRRPPPLNEVATNILEAFDRSIKPNENIAASIEKLAETYKVIESEKLKIEKQKLSFEIEKYKYEHPNFNMNDV